MEDGFCRQVRPVSQTCRFICRRARIWFSAGFALAFAAANLGAETPSASEAAGAMADSRTQAELPLWEDAVDDSQGAGAGRTTDSSRKVELWPNIIEELDEAALPPLPAGLEAVPGAGAPGSPSNTWWMNPPMWDANDSSIRLVDQSASQFQDQPIEPPLPIAPQVLPPDSGPPPSPTQFPVKAITDTPLGNLQQPGFLGTNRSLRIGGTRIRYGAQVATLTAYNTNVFGTSSNQQNDFVFYLQPSLVLEAGTKSSVRFVYSPSILKYARFKEFDTVNQNFLFASRLRLNKLEIGMDAAYLTQSGLFLSSQGQAQQRTLMARIFANYRITRKTDFLLAMDGNQIESTPGGNQTGYSFGAGIEHRISPKTSVGIGIMVGHFNLPQGSTDFQNVLIRLRYSPSAKLFFTADGGIQLRQSQTLQGASYATSSPLLEAKVTWLPTRKTTAAMRFFRNVAVDPFVPDAIQTTTGAELELTWQMLPRTKLEGKIGAGFSENTSLAGKEGDSFYFSQGTLAVIYESQEGLNMRVFTGFQQRLDDRNPESNYISTLSGVQLGLGF